MVDINLGLLTIELGSEFTDGQVQATPQTITVYSTAATSGDPLLTSTTTTPIPIQTPSLSVQTSTTEPSTSTPLTSTTSTTPSTFSTVATPSTPSTPSTGKPLSTSPSNSPDLQNATAITSTNSSSGSSSSTTLSPGAKAGLGVALGLTGLSVLAGLVYLVWFCIRRHHRRHHRRRHHDKKHERSELGTEVVAKRLSTSTTDSDRQVYREAIEALEHRERGGAHELAVGQTPKMHGGSHVVYG